MQLILDTNGLIVKQRNQCFQIIFGETEKLIAPTKITSIAVTKNCLLSSSAMILAAQNRIPIYFVDGIGKVLSTARSASFDSLSTIRRKQVFFNHTSDATNWILSIFSEKNKQELETLRWLINIRKLAKDEINQGIETLIEFQKYLENIPFQELTVEDIRPQLLGKEGSSARQYWEAVSACLPEHFIFENRTRRPATDPFNAALNYLYGMLYTTVENAIWSAGLDPYLGIFHVDEYNAPTLSFDLIETFRPWADRFLIEAFLDGFFDNTFVDVKQNNAHVLNSKGKSWLIPAWNEYLLVKERMEDFQVSRKNAIHRMADNLRNQIEDVKIPSEMIK
ncbi:CRISPR-associated endonuclease Cas1 [Arcicella aquatica]|uniref:CRISPR-associated endonuclease Cas1 n=1 Tax=Arcicella aquatica TaxID=217141 RepID=A0ABU5QTI5_9BACT|nr:CRISPR-associated endonuclease Cas1 [Arcicella aquatica]MEA5260328.1 CRISPR-associated endonuclease Cas1 [Arcicella aquatica]